MGCPGTWGASGGQCQRLSAVRTRGSDVTPARRGFAHACVARGTHVTGCPSDPGVGSRGAQQCLRPAPEEPQAPRDAVKGTEGWRDEPRQRTHGTPSHRPAPHPGSSPTAPHLSRPHRPQPPPPGPREGSGPSGSLRPAQPHPGSAHPAGGTGGSRRVPAGSGWFRLLRCCSLCPGPLLGPPGPGAPTPPARPRSWAEQPGSAPPSAGSGGLRE